MTAAVVGLEAKLIEVEADISNGLPNTIIVGLADVAVQESRERVRSALKILNYLIHTIVLQISADITVPELCRYRL